MRSSLQERWILLLGDGHVDENGFAGAVDERAGDGGDHGPTLGAGGLVGRGDVECWRREA